MTSTEHETTTRTITVTIGLSRDATLDDYARIMVAISQLPGVETIGGDPGVDFAKEPQA